MHIQLTTGALFAFAGLWVPGARGGPPSAAIITTTPNDLVAGIHNRMPVILRPEDEALWLDASVTDSQRVLALLKPFAADQMRAYQVAPLVNWFENDGPALIEPV
jgi:putative SOS response-associated peptidase YedK